MSDISESDCYVVLLCARSAPAVQSLALFCTRMCSAGLQSYAVFLSQPSALLDLSTPMRPLREMLLKLLIGVLTAAFLEAQSPEAVVVPSSVMSRPQSSLYGVVDRCAGGRLIASS